MGKRGSVLLHVLVTGALVALISATLMRMVLLRQQMMSRGAAALQDKRNDQAGLASVFETWGSANKGPCATIPPGFTMAPSPGTGQCGCTLTSNTNDASGTPLSTVYTCPNDGAPCTASRGGMPTGNPATCQMSIVSGE